MGKQNNRKESYEKCKSMKLSTIPQHLESNYTITTICCTLLKNSLIKSLIKYC